MDKLFLKEYLAKYGEVRALNDIAQMFDAVGNEWGEAGERALHFTFSDAAFAIADVAHKLETAEQNYAIRHNETTSEQIMTTKLVQEHTSLWEYFSTSTVDVLAKDFKSNQTKFVAKVKRLRFLGKFFSKKK